MRVLLTLLWLLPVPGQAFQILTPASEPCHERIMLAALGALPPPWSSPDDPSLQPLVDRLVARAEAEGMPSDRVSRAFVDDVARRYGFAGRPVAERTVLAAFVLGVRGPDTAGFTVLKLNELRVQHIDDARQGMHSLRRQADDGAEGNVTALANATATVMDRLDEAQAAWEADDIVAGERWTFPLYGEATVRTLRPAVRLGAAAHAVQDAYTHTLRDEALRVVSVLNFIDPVQGRVNEARDGLGHSDRLDTCDLSDPFDRARVAAARGATARLLAAADARFTGADPAGAAGEAVLADIYALRPGCTLDNAYCGSTWVGPARSQLSTPIDLSPGCQTGTGAPAGALWALALLGLMLRRRRHHRGPPGGQ